MNKVGMTKTYRRELEISLKPAKEMTDAVLEGKTVEFEIETAERASAIAAELAGLGAVVEVTNDWVP